MASAGYSEKKTPLATKLGIRSANKILASHVPEEYAALFGELPDDVSIVTKASAGEGAIVHLFAHRRVKIERDLGAAQSHGDGRRPLEILVQEVRDDSDRRHARPGPRAIAEDRSRRCESLRGQRDMVRR
jgi:hypothetical protein